MTTLGTECGWCGANPAAGLASIDDVRYCHEDDDDTCFQLKQREASGTLIDIAQVPSPLAMGRCAHTLAWLTARDGVTQAQAFRIAADEVRREARWQGIEQRRDPDAPVTREYVLTRLILIENVLRAIADLVEVAS